MNQKTAAENKHLTVIRARLRALLRELRVSPDTGQSPAVTEVNYLLLQLGESKDVEVTNRLITLKQLRKRLAPIPGAQRALEAVDYAISEGVK